MERRRCSRCAAPSGCRTPGMPTCGTIGWGEFEDGFGRQTTGAAACRSCGRLALLEKLALAVAHLSACSVRTQKSSREAHQGRYSQDENRWRNTLANGRHLRHHGTLESEQEEYQLDVGEMKPGRLRLFPAFRDLVHVQPGPPARPRGYSTLLVCATCPAHGVPTRPDVRGAWRGISIRIMLDPSA